MFVSIKGVSIKVAKLSPWMLLTAHTKITRKYMCTQDRVMLIERDIDGLHDETSLLVRHGNNSHALL